MSHNLSKNNVSARTRSLKHCYLKKFASYNFFFSFYYFALHMEPLRGHGDGKKKLNEGRSIFQCFCILSQNYRVLPATLHSLAKHICSPEKFAKACPFRGSITSHLSCDHPDVRKVFICLFVFLKMLKVIFPGVGLVIV